MTLKQEIDRALAEWHGYVRCAVSVYRVTRLGETIYTTASWAACEGRPLIVKIEVECERLGEAKPRIVPCKSARKAERTILAEYEKVVNW